MKNLKIRRKFLIILAVVLFGFVFISIMSFVGLSTVAQQTTDFKESSFEETQLAWKAQHDIRLLEFNLYRMITNNDPIKSAEFGNQANAAGEDMLLSLNTLKPITSDDTHVDAALELSLGIEPLVRRFITEAGGEDMAVPVKIMDEELLPIFDKIVTQLEEIGTLAASDADSFVASADGIKRNINIILLVMEVACMLAAIILVLKVSRSISKPLSEIEVAAKAMAGGILTTDIKYIARDEVGSVAESLRKSMSTVHGYIMDIQRAMGSMANGDFNVKPSQPFVGDFVEIEKSITKFVVNMSRAITQIGRTAEEVSSGSEHVSAGAQSLAQGATEQASAIEQLSAAVSEITGKVEENAAHTNEASEMAAGATEALIRSNAHMQELTDAMNDINIQSDEIRKIIKTIEDIAFQTNILALNAAVEAARAGNAGKGFAVVADEVKNLASKSASAAKDTTALIENSVGSIGKGVSVAEKAAVELSSIVTREISISQLVDSIAKATNEQSEALEQLTIGMDQVSSVVQTNSATSEESAAASEELSSQADILKAIIAEFKVLKNIPSGIDL